MSLAARVIWRVPAGRDTATVTIRAGSWLDLIGVVLNLLPVIGLTNWRAPQDRTLGAFKLWHPAASDRAAR